MVNERKTKRTAGQKKSQPIEPLPNPNIHTTDTLTQWYTDPYKRPYPAIILEDGFLPADIPAFKSINSAASNDMITKNGTTYRRIRAGTPYFGITPVREFELCSKEELKEHNENCIRSKILQHASLIEHEVSTKAKRTAEEVDPVIFGAKIFKKVFDWETPDTMRGFVPRFDEGKGLPIGRFAFKEREIWKEARERRLILENGGIEAMKLLEEDRIKERKLRRNKRERQERARKKAKRERGREVEEEDEKDEEEW